MLWTSICILWMQCVSDSDIKLFIWLNNEYILTSICLLFFLHFSYNLKCHKATHNTISVRNCVHWRSQLHGIRKWLFTLQGDWLVNPIHFHKELITLNEVKKKSKVVINCKKWFEYFLVYNANVDDFLELISIFYILLIQIVTHYELNTNWDKYHLEILIKWYFCKTTQ